MSGNKNLYTVNTGTGAATSLGNMGFASADLAFNSCLHWLTARPHRRRKEPGYEGQ